MCMDELRCLVAYALRDVSIQLPRYRSQVHDGVWKDVVRLIEPRLLKDVSKLCVDPPYWQVIAYIPKEVSHLNVLDLSRCELRLGYFKHLHALEARREAAPRGGLISEQRRMLQ